jgi:ATP-binding cassette subfamily B protein
MFKSIQKYIKKAWNSNRIFFLLLLVGAISSAAIIILSIYMPPQLISLIERGAALKDFIILIVLFVLALALLKSAYDYIDTLSFFHVIDIRSKLMEDCMQKALSTSYPNLFKAEFNGLLSKAMSLVSSDEDAAGSVWKTLLDLATTLLLLASLMFLLTGLNGWLILITLVSAVVSYFYSVHLNHWKKRRRNRTRQDFDQVHYVRQLEQDRSFALDLRSFAFGPWLFALEDRSLQRIEDFQKEEEKKFFSTDVLDAFLFLLRNGCAYLYLVWMITNGRMILSDFLMYSTALTSFSGQIFQLLHLLKKLSDESIELQSVFDLLEYQEPFVLEGPEIPVAESYVLECKDISFRYPHTERPILEHFNLRLEAGEKLAVVGLNGAGKTTLIKILAGFLEPDEGVVLLNGVDIRTYGRAQYYKLFTGVFQDSSILPLSIRTNIVQDALADDKKIWEALDVAELSCKVNQLPKKLETPISKTIYPDGIELSGGEEQRLQIARAFYRNAPILLLDEPTSALDPLIEREIYEKYNAITAGRSAIFVSHRLVSTKFSDRIILLEDGHILEEGSHEELLDKKGRYAELFSLQSQYYVEGED